MVIGICAIIRDCRPEYITEWLQWHRKTGFSKFIIYDNDSIIPIKCSDNDVVVYRWHGRVQQHLVYADQIRKQASTKYQHRCDWVAFIDDDEFIMVEDDNKTITDYIVNCEGDALGINWLLFGTSGIEKPFAPQPEMFTMRAELNGILLPNNNTCHIKSIIKTGKIVKVKNPHAFGCKTVGIFNNAIETHLTTQPTENGLWINHYWTRTKEDYQRKIKRGRATCLKHRTMEEFDIIETASTVKDTRASEKWKKWFR